MTAIVVCSHAELAQGFLDAVDMIAGGQEQLFAVGLQPGEGLQDLTRRIADCIDRSGAEKALVFADLFGASPANAAAMSLFSVQAETVLVTGVNLAAVLEAALSRDGGESLEAFAARICGAGRENLRVVTKQTIQNAGGAAL